MYAQVSLLGMSNPEKEGFQFDIMKRPTLDFHQTTPTPSSSSYSPTKVEEEEEEEGETNVASARKESQEKNKQLDDDDDDGFKTPTSLEHKIPEPKQCPPAPRRPRPLKRKASPTHSSNAAVVQPQLDFSKLLKKARTIERK
ncbi:hypothetical protein V6N13_059984 [Hibiscus sabdariffa]|uniref:Uncharacterized protein n=1 Tax=Hibiscus sabdariffa TaxID=183260 RepID=A0ABR2GBD2_9ROSI